MSKADQKRLALIEKVVRFANQEMKGKQLPFFEVFLRRYYRNFPLDELQVRSSATLYAIAYSHWQIVITRKHHQPVIVAFNPTLEKHGWQSPHSFVQIVTDDMPFIVDSIRMELARLGLTTYGFINDAGVKVVRKASGEIKAINPDDHRKHPVVNVEAFLSLEVSHVATKKELAGLVAALQNVLKDIALAVNDWRDMQARMREGVEELQRLPASVMEAEEKAETHDFLHWLLEYFTFLGYRDYSLQGEGKNKALVLVKESGLGVLRDSAHSKTKRYYSELPPQVQEFFKSRQLLWITKTNTRSTVHRPTYTDYIGLQRYNQKGELIGERRFIGLFTSDAYDSDPSRIPFLRKKVSTILARSGLSANGYGSKLLIHILKTLPRDDLVQASVDELYDIAMGIADIQERPVVRLFVRRDIFNRFVSCLVYVPRDNFNTDLRLEMQAILMEAFSGVEAFATPSYSESLLARVHYVVRVDQTKPIKFDVAAIEQRIREAVKSWHDRFNEALVSQYAADLGNRYFERYRKSFSVTYQEAYAPGIAAQDVAYLEKISQAHDLEMQLSHDNAGSQGCLRLRLYQSNHPIPLSDALPVLENMGLRVLKERGYQLSMPESGMAWINDFLLEYGSEALNLNCPAFKESFDKVWHGDAENDKFNSLILSAGLNWRQISLLRAYARYMRQIGFNISESYIQDTLIRHPEIVAEIVKLFETRFDPEISKGREAKLARVEKQLLAMLEGVSNINEDRALRRYYQIIMVTLRTNYYQTEHGQPKKFLVLKLASGDIPEIPLPAPQVEAFIYSPRVEGVHLRCDKVARGGIRWSDRHEDFRTEVLGLMKAQQVKNALIVPAGAKGGFVPKQLPENGSRDELQLEAIACYQDFINGLLDITDNLKNGKVIKPANTVFYDGDDPYFVVAADKGTATFSDIANRIARDRDYWLDDAFASGGSVGYDHKKMGITARGAWESVKHHFASLSLDVDKDPFTVVGIGDMAGDVFGNGMLLSDKINLLAAFNHIHIFLDPDPNMAKSFKERKRLFEMPGSSWADYDRKLISRGGGVFTRSQKWIKITPQVKEALNIQADKLTPTDLIRAILLAKVDLLWNGGIGTYVKASIESHEAVGDRANDAVRLNGCEVNARVVGEGGNLGLTQLGRIEYSIAGGLLNTDFIDNSAGVDCSDHEVNIKILLNQVVKAKKLSMPQRNHLLAKMTDDVADLVLMNNQKQNTAISLAIAQLPYRLHLYERFMSVNAKNGNIDRRLEFLPDSKMLLQRKELGVSLTRPELSTLLSYSKIIIKNAILQSDLLGNPAVEEYALGVFPGVLCKRYLAEIHQHYLHHDIIATQLSNQLVNELGPVFVQQLLDELKTSVSDIVLAYVVARQIFRVPNILQDIEQTCGHLPLDEQHALRIQVQVLLRRACRWLVRTYRGSLDYKDVVKDYTQAVDLLRVKLPKLVFGQDLAAYQARYDKLVESDVPTKVARSFACLEIIYPALNVIYAGLENKTDPLNLLGIYFLLAESLSLTWLRRAITDYPTETHMHMLARAMQKSELDKQQQRLASAVYLHARSSRALKTAPASQQVEAWLEQHQSRVEAWLDSIKQIELTGMMDFTIFSVLIGNLAEFDEVPEGIR